MSEQGKHVGGKALDASTDLVVPTLPAAASAKGPSRRLGKSQSTSNVSDGGARRSGNNRKKKSDENSLSRIAMESQRYIDPKHHDVVESKEATGKISKGTFADSSSAPMASGGGFFFPTLLAGAGARDDVVNLQPSGKSDLLL